MDKATYRKEMLVKRKHFSQEKLDSFEEVLIAYIKSLDPQVIFSYYSIKDELPTKNMIHQVWKDHKILIPRVNLSDHTMVPCPIQGEEDLIPGPYELVEASTDPYEGPIDLCLVPGLVFDLQGYRIGYGGGYYDRFLKDHSCKTIGLCLEDQIVEVLPHTTLDIPVQALLTNKGLIKL